MVMGAAVQTLCQIRSNSSLNRSKWPSRKSEENRTRDPQGGSSRSVAYSHTNHNQASSPDVAGQRF